MFETRIECSTAVNLVVGDILREDFLDVRRRDLTLLVSHILPVNVDNSEEFMLFDLVGVFVTGAETFVRIAIE